MRHVRFQDVDRTKWDKLVIESTNPRIYMLSWYLDISCTRWEAMVWGDYEAAIPLHVKTFFGLKYVPPPILVQQTGIIHKPGFRRKEALRAFFGTFTFKSFVRFGMSFHSDIPEAEISVVSGIRTFRKKNYLLELNKPYEQLLANYSENRKRNLKKAEKAGWTVSASDEIGAAVTMYRQNQALKQEDLKDTYRIINELYSECRKREAGMLYNCQDEKGNILAYCFFATFLNRIYYLFGSMNEEGKKHSAISCIFDYIISAYAQKNLLLDFEGGNIENIGKYFGSFGAGYEEYIMASRRLL